MSYNFSSSNRLPEGSSPPHSSDDDNNDESSGIPGLCRVCGDRASGTHYGVDTCEACKDFYKRNRRNKHLPPCSHSEQCKKNISVKNRYNCRHCRLQKCRDVGMGLQASRMGRPTNAMLRQKRQKLANQSVSTSVSHPSSVDSAVAHCSSRPPSSSDPNANKDPNSERNFSVIVCPRSSSNSPEKSSTCGLDPPCDNPDIESGVCSSSARSDQRLPNECDEVMGLEDTVPTSSTQATPLTDSSGDEDLHVTAESGSLSEQQESEPEGPLDLSKKD